MGSCICSPRCALFSVRSSTWLRLIGDRNHPIRISGHVLPHGSFNDSLLACARPHSRRFDRYERRGTTLHFDTRPQALAGEPYAYLKVPHSGVIAAPHGGPTLRAQVSTSAILRCSSLWILRSSIRSSSVPRPAERWSYVPFACLYSKTCASQAAYLWRSRHGSLRLIAAKTRLTILLRMMLRVTRSNPTEQAYEQHPSLMFTALL